MSLEEAEQLPEQSLPTPKELKDETFDDVSHVSEGAEKVEGENNEEEENKQLENEQLENEQLEENKEQNEKLEENKEQNEQLEEEDSKKHPLESESESQSSKRPKVEEPQQVVPTVPAPQPDPEPDMNNLPENPIPKHQQKHALSTIKAVKRLKDAGPFLQPVDTVKLQIPFYYNYITRPMDLATIERKINANAYDDPQQINQDFNLMVVNCATFNGYDAPIAQMARNVQASFEKHMLNMPPKDLPADAANTKSRRRATSETPAIRRGDSAEGGRPKREIHPPKSRDMPYDSRPRRRKFIPELRFCQQVIREIFNKRYDSFAYPFHVPVDPVALDCPTYFDVVKQPMDFGTIREKMSNNEYENAQDFEKDARLVFQNCYAFNPEGSAVNAMGHRLEEVFNKKWQEKPETPDSDDESDYEDYSDDDVIIEESLLTNPAIQYLEGQIERMRRDLDVMKRDLFEKLKTEKTRKRRLSKKKKKKGLKPVYTPHLNIEQKQELSEMLTDLSPKKMNKVITIIKTNLPHLVNGDEIELDMDQIDSKTLVQLYEYVVRKDVNGAPTVNGKKGKNSKALSEAEQARQIENIKRKLHEFDNPGSAPFPMEAESSDDDDISDESSEEE